MTKESNNYLVLLSYERKNLIYDEEEPTDQNLHVGCVKN